MSRFQELLTEHPDIEQKLVDLARVRGRSGPLSENEVREVLGLPPLNKNESPKTRKRRKFFAFADAALL